MLGFGKSGVRVDTVEKPTKRSWSLRKKLFLVAIAAIVIIGVAVGLGVGLTRDGGDDDDNEDDNEEDADGIPEHGPSRDSPWQPRVNASWQIVLRYPIDMNSSDDVDPDVDIYDLDLYDNDVETFDSLRDAGKKVICYFSAGSWEDWRDDKDDFDDADLGKELDGWPDERWVDVSSSGVRDIMAKRIRLAWRKGCDAIDPDNVDGFQNDNGLGLTEDDAIDFMDFLSGEARKYNMAIGLKNAGAIIPDVIDFVDFSVNEQCIQYSECDTFAQFIDADKPVFNIEYPAGESEDKSKITSEMKDKICSKEGDAADTEGFSIVIKLMKLNGWVEYCNGDTFETAVDS